MTSDPCVQPILLHCIQWQIPVFRFFQNRWLATKLWMRIDQFARTQTFSALFTLIAVCICISTVRAGTYNVSVGEEHFCFLVIVLLAFFFCENFLVIQSAEESSSGFVMNFFRSPVIDVETDSECSETLLDNRVVFITSWGVMPSFLARSVIGTPCSSEPQINFTSSPFARRKRTYISEGIYAPARWPMWTGPLA